MDSLGVVTCSRLTLATPSLVSEGACMNDVVDVAL
jgi:hypothetical protein